LCAKCIIWLSWFIYCRFTHKENVSFLDV
jgi:hypothetical protein